MLLLFDASLAGCDCQGTEGARRVREECYLGSVGFGLDEFDANLRNDPQVSVQGRTRTWGPLAVDEYDA